MMIEGQKKGSQLVFKKDDGNVVLFEFKDKSFYKVNPKSKTLRKLKNGAGAFFRGYSVEEVIDGIEDKEYGKLIKSIDIAEKRCRNVSTLLERFSSYEHLEHYHQAGIKFSHPDTFTEPVSSFAKPVREFMATSRIDFTYTTSKKRAEYRYYTDSWGYRSERCVWVEGYHRNNWEEKYMENEELFINICNYIQTTYFRDLEIYRLWVATVDRYNGKLDDFKELLTTYKLEYKALFDYLIRCHRYEAIDFNTAITLLSDYHRMSVATGKRNIEKYPKGLKMAHDLVDRNYKKLHQTYDEEKFAQVVDKDLEWGNKHYKIIVPTRSDDVKREGIELSHCVAGYVDRILDGTTQIVFLRKPHSVSVEKDAELFNQFGIEVAEGEDIVLPEVEKTTPLVTVEIRNEAIVQARGNNNRNVNEDEDEFLVKYAKAKKLHYTRLYQKEEDEEEGKGED